MAIQLNINTNANVIHTEKLERLHRSALPVAIRSTLNSLAFDVKKRTLAKVTKKTFEERNKTFFKANSKVDQAKGFDVGFMKSTIGMFENRLKGGNNFAVKDLEQQEHGGSIKGKSLIPLRSARISKSHKKRVRPKNRISQITNVVNSLRVRGKNPRQKFLVAVSQAGTGGYILHKSILYRVDSLSSSGKYQVKLTALYSYKKGRSVDISRRTKFMERASKISRKRTDEFYAKQAKKQIDRLTR